MCNTVVRQTVNANAYPDAERRSESMSATSELPSRQPSAHAGSTSLSGTLPDRMPGASPHSPRHSSATDADITPGGVRGFSPQQGRGGTSRTAQLFALADQCDLQGLEAAFEGMQSPRRAAAAQQGVSPAPAAPAATLRSADADSLGKDMHTTPQKAPLPGHGPSRMTEVTPEIDGTPPTGQVSMLADHTTVIAAVHWLFNCNMQPRRCSCCS